MDRVGTPHTDQTRMEREAVVVIAESVEDSWRTSVVRIMNHMAIWWSLEWRWRRLTGVHIVPVDLSASEVQSRILSVRGRSKQCE
jgi:hypothetical protein